jgi:hypothetical protein
MKHRLLAAALCLAALTVACGGDGGDDDNNTGPTQPAENGPTREATVAAPEGVPPIVYDALVRKDTIDLAGLTFYRQVPCVQGEASSEGPACRDTDDPNANVDAFPIELCDLMWVRPELVPDAYAGALGDDDVELVAAYEPRPGTLPAGAEAMWVVVMRTVDSDPPTGAAFAIEAGGRIVSIEAACNDLASLYADDRVARFIVEPQD